MFEEIKDQLKVVRASMRLEAPRKVGGEPDNSQTYNSH